MYYIEHNVEHNLRISIYFRGISVKSSILPFRVVNFISNLFMGIVVKDYLSNLFNLMIIC